MAIRYLRPRYALILAAALAAAAPSPAAAEDAWTDDPLTSQVRIKPIHINELRAAINLKRQECRLSTVTWRSPAPAAGVPIRAGHLNEIRVAISSLTWLVSGTAVTFLPPDPVVARTPVRASFFNEAREKIRQVTCSGDACSSDANCRGESGCDCGCFTTSKCVANRCVTTSHCCFAAGTRIATPGGSVPIETLGAGSPLLAYDSASGKAYASAVSGVSRRSSSARMTVRLSDGRVIRTTAEHPFYDPAAKDYRPIGSFVRGQSVLALRPDGGPDGGVRVESVEPEAEEGAVYSLSVEGKDRNYFADGILVHNKCSDPMCGKD